MLKRYYTPDPRHCFEEYGSIKEPKKIKKLLGK